MVAKSRRRKMIGNCPYCNNLIGSLNVGAVNAVEGIDRTWKAAMFTCPFCGKIIGATFDQTGIIDEIKKLIQK